MLVQGWVSAGSVLGQCCGLGAVSVATGGGQQWLQGGRGAVSAGLSAVSSWLPWCFFGLALGQCCDGGPSCACCGASCLAVNLLQLLCSEEPFLIVMANKEILLVRTDLGAAVRKAENHGEGTNQGRSTHQPPWQPRAGSRLKGGKAPVLLRRRRQGARCRSGHIPRFRPVSRRDAAGSAALRPCAATTAPAAAPSPPP